MAIRTIKDIPIEFLINNKDGSFFESDKYKGATALFDRLKKDSPLLPEEVVNNPQKYSNFIPYLVEFLASRYDEEDGLPIVNDDVADDMWHYLINKGTMEKVNSKKNMYERKIFPSEIKTIVESVNPKLRFFATMLPVNNILYGIKKAKEKHDTKDIINNLPELPKSKDPVEEIILQTKYHQSQNNIDVYDFSKYRAIILSQYLNEYYNDNGNALATFANPTSHLPELIYKENRYTFSEHIKILIEQVKDRYYSDLAVNNYHEDFNKIDLKKMLFNRLNKSSNDFNISMNTIKVDAQKSIRLGQYKLRDKISEVNVVSNGNILHTTDYEIIDEGGIVFVSSKEPITGTVSYIFDTTSREIISLNHYRQEIMSLISPTKMLYVHTVKTDFDPVNFYMLDLDEGFAIEVYINGMRVPYSSAVERDSISIDADYTGIFEVLIVPQYVFTSSLNEFAATRDNILDILNNRRLIGREYNKWMLSPLS